MPTRRVAVALATLVTVFSLTQPVQAAPGDPDSTFGGGGLVTNRFDEAGLAAQPDGKIVFLSEDFTVVRYKSNGVRDSSFSGDGRAEIVFEADSQSASAIAVQPDGKIVVAGTVFGAGGTKVAFARLKPNGQLDASFNDDGLTIKGPHIQIQPSTIAIDSRKRIIVGSGNQILRLKRNGGADRSFGDAGVATVTPRGTDGNVQAVGVQSHDRVIIAGTTRVKCHETCKYVFFAGRLRPSGMLDRTFANKGYRTVDIGNEGTFLRTVAVHPGTSEPTLGGQACDGIAANDCYFAVARLTREGSLEATGAPVPQGLTFSGYITGIAFQGGRTLVAGNWDDGDFERWSVARLTANLELDGSFGDGGFAYTTFGEDGASARHVVVAGGRVVSSGFSGLVDFPGGLAAYKAS